jgi:hypothetical protein
VGRGPAIAVALAYISGLCWLGGLFRLIGELLVRQMKANPPDMSSSGLVVQAAVVLVALGGLIGLMFASPWYRRLLRQARADAYGSRGLTQPPAADRRRDLGRSGRLAILLILPSIVVAVLLPGPIAAAAALVAGLILRVVTTIAVSVARQP